MAYRPDSQEEAFDYLFKLVLIGDAGVGKTCVVQRFMGSAFVERHSSTIGVDFTMRTVVIDGKRIKVTYQSSFTVAMPHSYSIQHGTDYKIASVSVSVHPSASTLTVVFLDRFSQKLAPT